MNNDLDYVKAIQDAEYGSINIYKFGKNNVFGKVLKNNYFNFLVLLPQHKPE